MTRRPKADPPLAEEESVQICKIQEQDLPELIQEGWRLQEEIRAFTAPLRTAGDRELNLVLH